MNEEVQLTSSSNLEWKPLNEPGSPGIDIKVLRYNEAQGRPATFLLRFEAGASYPAHTHPAGEEVFVLDGEIRFANYNLKTGDYLYTPPNGKHSVFTKTGCTFLIIVPEQVVFLKDLKSEQT